MAASHSERAPIMTSIFVLRRDPGAVARLLYDLECTPRVQVVGSSRSIYRTRQLLTQSGADILVADLRLDDGTICGLARELGERLPRRPRLLVVADSTDDPLLWAALRAGADGYAIEGDAKRPIPLAVAEVMRDECTLAQSIARQIGASLGSSGAAAIRASLHEADRELLGHLVEGRGPTAIARLRGDETSPGDVRFQTRQILRRWQLAEDDAAALPEAA